VQFQLEEAVENEDFAEAAKLKRDIIEATGNDAVAHVMAELKVRNCFVRPDILFHYRFLIEMCIFPHLFGLRSSNYSICYVWLLLSF
jgi:hypothetical protein